MKTAIFILGGPGSGKDLIIKSFCENFKIREYALEQIKTSLIKESCVVKGNAYNIDKITKCKDHLESTGFQTCVICVDVNDSVSKERMSNRNIDETIRFSKYIQTKNSFPQLNRIFENFIIFENNKDIKSQQANMRNLLAEIFNFIHPLSYIREASVKNFKNYVYKRFMKNKDAGKSEKFYSDTPIKPSGYNEYDIRTAGQSSVVHNCEDIGSPENLSQLTGMNINPTDELEKGCSYEYSEKKKTKLNPRFNSPTKNSREKEIVRKTKKILFRRD